MNLIKMKKLFIFSIILLLTLVSAEFVMTQGMMDVTLQWYANTESDLAGYNVYWGSKSGPPYENVETMWLDEDENLDSDLVQKTIIGLTKGTMHYFVVTAFDTEDLESGYSNEVRTDGTVGRTTGQPPSTPGGCIILTVK